MLRYTTLLIRIFFISVYNVFCIILKDGTDSYELTGLSRGGEQLGRLKKNYSRAVKLLVELASLQVSNLSIKFSSFDD